jgi:hypothetical protein
MVGAGGFEAPSTSALIAVDRHQKGASDATQGDSKQREVSASTPLNADDAIRTAAKLAIDAGDMDRAAALIGLLAAKPKPAPVLTLASRKQAR